MSRLAVADLPYSSNDPATPGAAAVGAVVEVMYPHLLELHPWVHQPR